jgi:hypothetical protein
MPVFVQVYPAIVILNAVKNPCILPEVPKTPQEKYWDPFAPLRMTATPFGEML